MFQRRRQRNYIPLEHIPVQRIELALRRAEATNVPADQVEAIANTIRQFLPRRACDREQLLLLTGYVLAYQDGRMDERVAAAKKAPVEYVTT